MPIYEILPDSLHEVDIIIAGGGTAGCVVASRLADADSGLSILVIEGGPSSFGLPTVENPALFLAGLVPTSQTTLFYKTRKESSINDREQYIPTGGTLGGGSAINLVMYSRAQRSDFDSWNTPGWTTEDMLPYLKKLETYHGPDPNGVHGFSGPLHITGDTFRSHRSEHDFIQASTKIDYPEIGDLTSLDENNGVHRALRYVGLDGKRQDTASRYLKPILESGANDELHVVVNSRIKRILFDGTRASAVEFRPNTNDGSSIPSPLRIVRARKMVVLCCGALGTPLVLERSGVGSAELLGKAGVDVVAELPGVGENYLDHQQLTYSYMSGLNERETLDSLVSGRLDPIQLIERKDPILGWNAMDTACKLRPTDADVATLGLAFQEAWDRDYKRNLNKPLVMGSMINGYPGDPTSVPVGQYISMSVFSAYSYSRGSVHITGPGLEDEPDIETGFLRDPLDIKIHVWAYKKHREIFRRMEMYRGELESSHPPFPKDSKAACVQLQDKPFGDIQDIQNIQYSAADDQLIEDWVRDHVSTTWHALGTCKMGSIQEGGVVDSALNVHGVKSLKIADLSIPPQNVAANTMNTAVAIGEKAADIILKELDL